MYGFKPKRPVQQLADGGLVAKMKSADAGAAPFGSRGLNQLREMPAKMLAMGFGPAKAEAPAPAPVTDPRAAKLQALIPQMEAMGFKQAQAAADGGLIRGPGTGTSDSIPDEMEPGTFIMPADSTQALGLNEESGEGEKMPVRVSNGEYQLPPERVQAIGAAVLEAIKGATHTPTGQGAEGQPIARGFKPKGGEPQQFFADGGRIKSPEELARLQNQTAMYVQGAQAAAANRPPAPAAAPVAPAPAPIGAAFVPPSMGRKPPSPVAAPAPAAAAAAVPATQVEGWRTKAVMDGAAEDAQSAWDKGDVAGAAGSVARGAVTAIPTAVGEFAYNTAAPLINAAAGFGRGLFGGEANAAQPTPDAPAAPQSAPTPAIASPAAVGPTGGSQGAPTSAAMPPVAPANTVQTGGNQVAPGAYRNAPGQYSDNAAGMGMPAGFTGQPSPQNMAAAQNLAQRSAGGAPAPVAAGFPGMTAPTVRNSTNDWAARNNLRNLEVSASSITNNGGRFDRTRGNNPAQAAYKAALATDQTLQQAQPGLDAEAMRQNGGLQREGMQQEGATTRTGMQEAGANTREAGRVNLAGQELGMKREAQGFQTRAAAQVENLRSVLLDPKATPEQKRQAQQNMQALTGKTEDNRFTVVPGGQEWDATAGAMRNVPARVLNNQSGQFVDQPGQGATLPPGMVKQVGTANGKPVYEDAKGNRFSG